MSAAPPDSKISSAFLISRAQALVLFLIALPKRAFCRDASINPCLVGSHPDFLAIHIFDFLKKFARNLQEVKKIFIQEKKT